MPPVSRVTLKDVAARAGVSYQTVSKVINGQGTVGRETEELIWQVVAELGYRTNVTARSLRKQATGLIGYTWTPMPPDRANPILDRFLTGTMQAAEAVHTGLYSGLKCRQPQQIGLPARHGHAVRSRKRQIVAAAVLRAGGFIGGLCRHHHFRQRAVWRQPKGHKPVAFQRQHLRFRAVAD